MSHTHNTEVTMAICRQGNASVDLQSRFAWNRFYELKAAIEDEQRSAPPIDDAAEWSPDPEVTMD